MRFEIVKREVNLRWSHISLVIAAVLALAIPLFALAFVWAAVFPPDATAPFWFNLDAASAMVENVFRFVSRPVLAFVLLAVATSLFKMRKDVALCRSLACATFLVVFGLFMALFAALAVATGFSPASAEFFPELWFLIPVFNVLGNATAAIILYLWLLAVAVPDWKKAEKTAVPAALFALLMLVVANLPMFLDIAGGRLTLDVSASILTIHNAFSFLTDLMFGFIVLYHLQGRKLDNAAYLFAVLYVASPLLVMVGSLVVPGVFKPWDVLAAALRLALLYGLSRIDLKDIL